MYRYFKSFAGFGNGSYIYYWRSKELILLKHPIIVSPNKLSLNLDYYGTKTRVEFAGSFLKQYKVTFNHENVVNIYIVYEISKTANISSDGNYPILQNTLFGAVSFAKNADIDRYKYSGY